jgi:hypothetical protein
MALNGSTTVTVTPNDPTIMEFSWEAVQDKEAKTSTINWTLALISKENGGFHDVADADIYPWTVVIDSQEFSGKSNIKIPNNSSKVLASGSAVLTHSEDGTKIFEYSFTQNFGHVTWHDGSVIDDVTGTGTAELDPFVKKFDILGCVNGLIMTLCGRPIQWPKGEPVGYLYNGVGPLPAISPYWDSRKYPYLIVHSLHAGEYTHYYLYAYEKQPILYPVVESEIPYFGERRKLGFADGERSPSAYYGGAKFDAIPYCWSTGLANTNYKEDTSSYESGQSNGGS